MDKDTRDRLEAAGFKVGDAEDFLGLTEQERRLVELRVAASRAVRRRREERGVTQKQLAALIKSSQSRVAKIEAAAADVSLDLLIKTLFAAGGEVADLAALAPKRRPAATGRTAKSKVTITEIPDARTLSPARTAGAPAARPR